MKVYRKILSRYASDMLSLARLWPHLRKVPRKQKYKLWKDTRLIARSGLFDEDFYLKRNRDVARSKIHPLVHYVRYGGLEGRAPSDKFDASFYLQTNSDVKKSQMNPLLHYLRYGRAEGRKPLSLIGSSIASGDSSNPTKRSKVTGDPWDTRFLNSVSLSAGEGAPYKKLYIVPATLRERNTTRYRVNHLKEIAANYTDVEIVNLYEPPASFYSDIDRGDCVVLIQRLPMSNRAIRDFLMRVKSSSALIVYEIDDQIFNGHELEKWRLEGLQNSPKEYFEAMKVADQFIVSTNALRQRIEDRLKRPVHVVHNTLSAELIDLSRRARQMRSADAQPFVVGYAAGSATHDADLAAALPGVARFLEAYPAAEFHLIGPTSLPEDVLRRFGSRIVQRSSVGWRDLPEILASFTIQIVPLEFCKFNKFKSHIRFLESAAVGVPVIASQIGEQAATIINGQTGLLVDNTAEAWFEALKELHDNALTRHRISQNAAKIVEAYWTTASPFQQQRLRHILTDLSSGILRDKISILMVTYNPLQDIKEAVDSIYAHTRVPFELLIWNNSAQPETRQFLASLPSESCMVIDLSQNVGKARGANHLFRVASERFICAIDDDYAFPAGWDVKMLAAAKAVPNLGWLSTNLTKDSSGMRDIGRIETFDSGISVMHPDGVGGWVVFTSSTARERLGFYREHGLYGGIDGDYNRRARRSKMYTGYVRTVVGRHKVNRRNNVAWELFKQRIQDEMRIHGKDSDLVTAKFEDFFSSKDQSLSVALKICTSTTHDENVWGDTHFARGLASALEGLDYRVRIDKHEEWYSKEEPVDVVVHLFGLHKYKPDPKHINILWVISHTDLIDKEFLEGFDYVFCASKPVTDLARGMVPDIQVETLHQCTDLQVFVPDNDVKKDIDVAFIGNSRRIYRDAVRFAVQSGVKVAIWGTKWEAFVDKSLIRGQSLSSHEVADVYRRAKVVLNDHWEDQKTMGLVNNRIFDVLSCGTIVLSDENIGIESVFGQAKIPTFTDRESFERKLQELLSGDDLRVELTQQLGELVRANHTFKQRAEVVNRAIVYIVENYVDYKSERQWRNQQRLKVAQ